MNNKREVKGVIKKKKNEVRLQEKNIGKCFQGKWKVKKKEISVSVTEKEIEISGIESALFKDKRNEKKKTRKTEW